MGRYFFTALAVVVAVAFFWLENYIVTHRVASLAESRLETFRSSLVRIDHIVEERNREGFFFRFLGIRKNTGEPSDSGELNPSVSLVESAIVLDRRFTTIARSGRDLSQAELAQVRQSGKRSLITDTGLIRRYELTDFNSNRIAHLVLVVRGDDGKSAGAVFAASLDLSTVVPFASGAFNNVERQRISESLRRQSSAGKTLTLHGSRYFSLRRLFLDENLLFFVVSPLPPLYSFVSIYAGMIILLGCLIVIILGQARDRYTRREISERILAAHSKVIDTQSRALDELTGFTRGDAAREVSEKIISAAGDETKKSVEEKIKAAHQERAKPPAPPPLVISIMPENREFRFMNPSLAPRHVARQAKQGGAEQRLRERAFSDELKNLMAEISAPATGPKPAPAKEILSVIEDFENRYRFPAIDQYIYFLNELYFDEVSEAELAQAMRVAGDAVQSREFAILFYEPGQAVFRTGFLFGVPEELKQTFYLLPKDSVLANDFPEYGYIEATPALKKNSYFKKRFPADFADRLRGLHIFNVTENFLRARVVFFDTARGGALADAGTIATVRDYLKQVAPAISMYFLDADEGHGNPRDLAAWGVQELKESVAVSGGNAPLISQYVFESALTAEAMAALVREIASKLMEGEKVLILSPSHLAVSHSAASSKVIEEAVAAQGLKFIIKESEFAKATRNLYTFIEF